MSCRFKKARDRRAVSEVVSTLVLVAVVVALGVFVFTFASGGLGSLTGSFTELISGQGTSVSQRFVVEQVAFTFAGTPGADVYVRNVGSVTTTIVAVYVVDQTGGTVVSRFVSGSLPLAVNVGAFADVDLHQAAASFTPEHGHTYSFKVTSSVGNSVTFYAEAT